MTSSAIQCQVLTGNASNASNYITVQHTNQTATEIVFPAYSETITVQPFYSDGTITAQPPMWQSPPNYYAPYQPLTADYIPPSNEHVEYDKEKNTIKVKDGDKWIETDYNKVVEYVRKRSKMTIYDELEEMLE